MHVYMIWICAHPIRLLQRFFFWYFGCIMVIKRGQKKVMLFFLEFKLAKISFCYGHTFTWIFACNLCVRSLKHQELSLKDTNYHTFPYKLRRTITSDFGLSRSQRCCYDAHHFGWTTRVSISVYLYCRIISMKRDYGAMIVLLYSKFFYTLQFTHSRVTFNNNINASIYLWRPVICWGTHKEPTSRYNIHRNTLHAYTNYRYIWPKTSTSRPTSTSLG